MLDGYLAKYVLVLSELAVKVSCQSWLSYYTNQHSMLEFIGLLRRQWQCGGTCGVVSGLCTSHESSWRLDCGCPAAAPGAGAGPGLGPGAGPGEYHSLHTAPAPLNLKCILLHLWKLKISKTIRHINLKLPFLWRPAVSNKSDIIVSRDLSSDKDHVKFLIWEMMRIKTYPIIILN